ncbi:MAG: hypothetical protein P8X43_09340 [Maritimibacter sp.]
MEPQNRVGIAQLTSLALQGVDLHPLRSYLLEKGLDGAERAGALMDLSVIDQLYGDLEQGLAWQAEAIESCPVFRTDRGTRGRKKLLVFALPTDIGGNTPIEFLIQSDEFDILTYYLTPGRQVGDAVPLPRHDVAFCAAPADARDAEAFFAEVRALTKDTGKPALNAFGAPSKLGRVALPQSLPDVKGLRLANTVRAGRDALIEAVFEGTLDGVFGKQTDFPCVIRPVGSHAGHGLEKVDTADALGTYLMRSEAEDFYLADYIDYRSDDGQFRKYRIVFIDGKAYPCHLAIAGQWDVWYMKAEMQEDAEKRREEEAFMEAFDSEFGARHKAGFDALIEAVGMEYFGIDCSEDRDGNLVVFEADNSFIVHDMECKTTFPYKTRHMQRLFGAFENMLTRAALPE